MTLDLTQLFLFAIFTTSLHWLLARSEIAKPLWSRATGWLSRLLSCPACSGFWLGALIGSTAVSPLTLFLDPITRLDAISDIVLLAIVHGVLGVFVTPIAEGVLMWGLEASAIEVDEDVGAAPQPIEHQPSSAITPSENFLRTPK